LKELTTKNVALAQVIESRLGEKLERLESQTGELGYSVAPANLLTCCRTLRDEEALSFELLVDLCGVDYLSYGRTEWDTASATTTGFSRGVLRGSSGDDEELGETQYRPAARFAVVDPQHDVGCGKRRRTADGRFSAGYLGVR